jgi:hypothetical protein
MAEDDCSRSSDVVYTAKKGITRTAVVVKEREITDDTYPKKILVVAVSWCDKVEF